MTHDVEQGMTPWEGFIDYLDKEDTEIRPWLADEEMVFLLTRIYIRSLLQKQALNN